jgi:hypothetical protein
VKIFLQHELYSLLADFMIGIRQAEECSRWADEKKRKQQQLGTARVT